jgi:hypothetical protein
LKIAADSGIKPECFSKSKEKPPERTTNPTQRKPPKSGFLLSSLLLDKPLQSQSKLFMAKTPDTQESLLKELTEDLASQLLGEQLPQQILDRRYTWGKNEHLAVIVPANERVTRAHLRKLAKAHEYAETDPSPLRIKLRTTFAKYEERFAALPKPKRKNAGPEIIM